MRYSAILLAGYNNKRAVEKYSRTVTESYHEKYIETGYKPLREFSLHRHGRHISKPLIQFTLEELLGMEQIRDIVIVGNQTLLENRLGPLLENQEKPWKILDQKSLLSESVKERFGLGNRDFPVESIGGNILKAYSACDAAEKKEPALFIASDSPMTDRNFIADFLRESEALQNNSDIILPAVPVGLLRDQMGRRPLLLVNDTEKALSCRADLHGRCGFRLSSLLLCRLDGVDIRRINDVYSMRKALSPKVQLQIFRICRDLGYPGLYRKYFRQKDLSIRECENILSRFVGVKVRALPIEGEKTTYDYDGTRRELKKLTRMLRRKL